MSKDSNPPTRGTNGNKKSDHSLKNTIVHYTPSIVALIPITIALSMTSRYDRPHRQSLEETEDNIDYHHYLYLTLEITTGVFFITTLFCNFVLGRRPSNDDHHSPLYGRLIEGAQDNLPLALAIGNSIIRFVTGTAAGDNAEQTEHAVSGVLTAAVVSQRITAIDYRLYDHAMDRSLLLDGNMRWLEYVAMRGENAIIYVLESLAHVGLLAMTIGVTRIQVTDSNRLYWIASIYSATDVTEDALVLLLNEYIYYLEVMVDRVAPALRAVGLADPKHPIHAVTPRAIDEVDKHLQAGMAKAAHAVEHAAEEVGNFFSHGWHSFTSIFTKENTHHSIDQHHAEDKNNKDDEDKKMTPEELDAHNKEQQELKAGGVVEHHGSILGGLANALHLRHQGPSVAVAQQENGSYGVDFAALPAGRIDINNLPDASIVCLDGLSANSRIIVKADGICYEFCRVSTVHHSGSFGFMSQHHREIGEIQGHDVHSYRPNDEYVLVRVDECPNYEMRIYGASYNGFDSHSI